MGNDNARIMLARCCDALTETNAKSFLFPLPSVGPHFCVPMIRWSEYAGGGGRQFNDDVFVPRKRPDRRHVRGTIAHHRRDGLGSLQIAAVERNLSDGREW
jgi:hypothetical protein